MYCECLAVPEIAGNSVYLSGAAYLPIDCFDKQIPLFVPELHLHIVIVNNHASVFAVHFPYHLLTSLIKTV